MFVSRIVMNKMTASENRFAIRTGAGEALLRSLIATILALVLAAPAAAGPREQARRIHDRIAGVPPTATVLAEMADAIVAGSPEAAADIAMENVNFYNVTVKNFAAPWTNRDQSVFVPLNDYIATVIGMVRDEVPFNTLLSEDIQYIGRSGVVPAGPSASNNDHYEQLEANHVNLRDELVRVTQSSVNGLPALATAGVMTSRAAAKAFFIAGTNRAMFRFTLLNHMCNDLEALKDPTLAPDRIRQDVSRSPGGDSRLFLNNCVGCHTGMDPMAQAFAYYNYPDVEEDQPGAIQYTPGSVQPKYFNNDLNFPQGFRTPDDNWENYWRNGQNAYLGFDPGLPGQGTGAKSLGEELGNSYAFAQCQVRKVFKAVCLRDPQDANDRNAIDQIVNTFRTTGYSMKQVFADSAVHCMGQ